MYSKFLVITYGLTNYLLSLNANIYLSNAETFIRIGVQLLIGISTIIGMRKITKKKN
jgi:hypothetical protein